MRSYSIISNKNKIKRENRKNMIKINFLKNKLIGINNNKIVFSNKKKKLSRADLIRKKKNQENSKFVNKEIKELKSNLIKDDNKNKKGMFYPTFKGKIKRRRKHRPSSMKRKKLLAKKKKF